MSITIKKQQIISGAASQLPSSKSISNRALLINAISGNQSVVSNLSAARDTQLMRSLVNSPDTLIDVMDAGTTMRFLTAFFALSGKNKVLTGTPRMKERPIGLLVDALRTIGAEISYIEKEGFPPIETKGFQRQRSATVNLPGNVSSQYISALMMVAPTLPQGLTVQIVGELGSRPYVEMTASLMRKFGGVCAVDGQTITVSAGNYQSAQVHVEADWSAISYWLAFVALADRAEITLPHVDALSLQGDRVITDLMEHLGVSSRFDKGSLILTKQSHRPSIEWNFKDCPDLAQTVLPVCAAKGISGIFTGLESLRIKETDRIAALQNELGKLDARLDEQTSGVWHLHPGKVPNKLSIHTYHDHRMAMGFAPLATLSDVSIDDPTVVNKSYPGFWKDMQAVGFVIDQ